MIFEEKVDYLFIRINSRLDNVYDESKRRGFKCRFFKFEISYLFYFFFDYQFQRAKHTNLIYPSIRKRIQKELKYVYEDKILDSDIEKVINARTQTFIQIIGKNRVWKDIYKDIMNYLCGVIMYEYENNNVCGINNKPELEGHIPEDVILHYGNVKELFLNTIRTEIALMIDDVSKFIESNYILPDITFTDSESERKYYYTGLKYCKTCHNAIKPDNSNRCPVCEEIV
jgi:hypothetical protein